MSGLLGYIESVDCMGLGWFWYNGVGCGVCANAGAY